jgi:hypothetical protein
MFHDYGLWRRRHMFSLHLLFRIPMNDRAEGLGRVAISLIVIEDQPDGKILKGQTHEMYTPLRIWKHV